ncbi:hypothetical protein GGR54DRAFT_608155 [Hypoxylon sp. NC1633]|nr:hypothetical protein GGR54DRAFT_608155 [Hypoxylon sp. NC1633]
MESFFFLASFNLDILVEKEIVVHADEIANGAPAALHLPTSELQDTTLSLPPGKMAPRPDVSPDREEGLAEFFRRPPPPGNFMSVPDDQSISSVDNRWNVFKVLLKKRKSQNRRRPPIITLPDSAVSAKTTSGHRYIAISIPSQQLYSGLVPPSQHLASRSTGTERTGHHREIHPRLGSAHKPSSGRDAKASKPVIEDHESLSSTSLGPRSLANLEGITRLAPPPRKVSLLSTVPSQEVASPRKGKEPVRRTKPVISGALTAMSPFGSAGASFAMDRGSKSRKRSPERQTEQQHISARRGPEVGKAFRLVDVPPIEGTERVFHQKQAAEANSEQTTSDSSVAKRILGKAGKPLRTSRIRSVNPPTGLTLPVRTSSRRAQTTVARHSHTGNIVSSRPALPSSALSSHHGVIGGSAVTGTRGSFAESLITTESSPRLLEAETATAYQSVPIVVRPPSRPEIDSPLNLDFPTPPSYSINRSVQTDLPAPAVVAEGVSRKDRVRERKQRDMEKLIAQLRGGRSPASQLLRPEAPAESALAESPILGRFSQELGSPPPPRSFLRAKRSDIGPSRPKLQQESLHLSPEAVLKKRLARSASAPLMPSSSSTSLLESSSMPWEDRTDYYRRRERQEERREVEARRVRRAAKALADEEERQFRLAHQMLLQRESRTRDIEKSLRRLERNGDELKQSLMSLMENLETLMKTMQDWRSAPAYHVTTSVPPQHGRSQTVRLVRSLDSPLEHPPSQAAPREPRSKRHRPPSLRIPRRESSLRGELGTASHALQSSLGAEDIDTDIPARLSALEALQQDLKSQTYQAAHAEDATRFSSSATGSPSNDEGSLAIMEPLMRDLQVAARSEVGPSQAEGREQQEGGGEDEGEGRASVDEREVFNLF